MPHPVLAEFWTVERLDRLYSLCKAESLAFSVVAERLQREEPTIAPGESDAILQPVFPYLAHQGWLTKIKFFVPDHVCQHREQHTHKILHISMS